VLLRDAGAFHLASSATKNKEWGEKAGQLFLELPAAAASLQ
jgi:hypothetical protein